MPSSTIRVLVIFISTLMFILLTVFWLIKPHQNRHDESALKLVTLQQELKQTQQQNKILLAKNDEITKKITNIKAQMVPSVYAAQTHFMNWVNQAKLTSLLIESSVQKNNKNKVYDEGIISYHLSGESHQYSRFRNLLNEQNFVSYIAEESLSKNKKDQLVIEGRMIFLMTK